MMESKSLAVFTRIVPRIEPILKSVHNSAGSEEELDVTCAICDERVDAPVECSCEETFCQLCFRKHLARKPMHREVNKSHNRMWSWASGVKSALTPETWQREWEKDEANKWFGLHVDTSKPTTVCRIVETQRFSSLMEESLHAYPRSPQRQFPSIVSFVGETGVGKSTISTLPDFLI